MSKVLAAGSFSFDSIEQLDGLLRCVAMNVDLTAVGASPIVSDTIAIPFVRSIIRGGGYTSTPAVATSALFRLRTYPFIKSRAGVAVAPTISRGLQPPTSINSGATNFNFLDATIAGSVASWDFEATMNQNTLKTKTSAIFTSQEGAELYISYTGAMTAGVVSFFLDILDADKF